MIGKRIRHVQRYHEIINSFIRNGFSYFVKDIGLIEMFSPRKKIVRESSRSKDRTLGERIYTFLEELGPSFIKFGQLASTRRDLISDEIIRELERLQDDVVAFPYEAVEKIIYAELGDTPENLFKHFSVEPLAAASIGQVHEAILKDGTKVAIKIQRPEIKQTIETDLEIMLDLARLAEARLSWAKQNKVTELVNEFAESIQKELNYELEGQNADRIARNCAELDTVIVPKIYWEYSTKKVLTMDFVSGIKINDIEKLKEANFNCEQLAHNFAEIFLQQVLIDGFFHADPHPGNVFVTEDGKIALIDFGLAGRLQPHLKYQFASLVIALQRQSTDGIMRSLSEMEIIPTTTDINTLRADIDDLKEKYYTMSFTDIKLGEVLSELFAIAHRHKIKFPSEFTILGKVVLTVEAIMEQLDPNINIMQLAEPFSRQLLKDRYSFKNISRRFIYNTMEFTDDLVKLPKNLRDIMAMVKKGKVKHEMTVPQLDTFLEKIDKVANRLSYSIVLLSFSIIMVGLIIGTSLGHDNTLFWRLPVVEIGFIIATAMVIWLLYSIFRSGRWF